MTPEARAAAEAALNNMLQHLIVVAVLGWWVRYAWRRWGLPGIDLRRYFTLQPRPMSSVSEREEHMAPILGAASNSTEGSEQPDERTNEATYMPRTALYLAADRLLLDRTRMAVIAILVAAGWKTTDIRDLLKGTASDIGDQVRAAQASLVVEELPRTLLVDGKRTIAR